MARKDFMAEQAIGMGEAEVRLSQGEKIGKMAPFPTTRCALLAGLQELLRPAVVHALRDAFLAAQLGNAGLAAQALKHDADLLYGRVLPARRPPDIPDRLLRTVLSGRWLPHRHLLFGLTMSPKASLTKSTQSVWQVVTGNTSHHRAEVLKRNARSSAPMKAMRQPTDRVPARRSPAM